MIDSLTWNDVDQIPSRIICMTFFFLGFYCFLRFDRCEKESLKEKSKEKEVFISRVKKKDAPSAVCGHREWPGESLRHWRSRQALRRSTRNWPWKFRSRLLCKSIDWSSSAYQLSRSLQGRNAQTNEIVAIKRMTTGRKQTAEVHRKAASVFVHCNFIESLLPVGMARYAQRDSLLTWSQSSPLHRLPWMLLERIHYMARDGILSRFCCRSDRR